MTYQAVLFLSDGVSWNIVEGSSICILDTNQLNLLQKGLLSPQDLNPLFEIGLKDCTLR